MITKITRFLERKLGHTLPDAGETLYDKSNPLDIFNTPLTWDEARQSLMAVQCFLEDNPHLEPLNVTVDAHIGIQILAYSIPECQIIFDTPLTWGRAFTQTTYTGITYGKRITADIYPKENDR